MALMNESINDVWEHIITTFDENVLSCLPYHSHLANEIFSILGKDDISNLMFYGQKGFPINVFLYTIIHKICKKPLIKRYLKWQNQINYIETPFCFEIDIADPHHPKDVEVLASFIKEMIQAPGVFNNRHIIIYSS